MSALRVVGTLLWVGLMFQFGSLAVAGGHPLFWAIFIGCLLAFAVQVYAMQRRDDRAAATSMNRARSV